VRGRFRFRPRSSRLTLRIPVQATYELGQAPAALSALAGEHTRGKLAIQVL
jgi:hypothetical protein